VTCVGRLSRDIFRSFRRFNHGLTRRGPVLLLTKAQASALQPDGAGGLCRARFKGESVLAHSSSDGWILITVKEKRRRKGKKAARRPPAGINSRRTRRKRNDVERNEAGRPELGMDAALVKSRHYYKPAYQAGSAYAHYRAWQTTILFTVMTLFHSAIHRHRAGSRGSSASPSIPTHHWIKTVQEGNVRA